MRLENGVRVKAKILLGIHSIIEASARNSHLGLRVEENPSCLVWSLLSGKQTVLKIFIPVPELPGQPYLAFAPAGGRFRLPMQRLTVAWKREFWAKTIGILDKIQKQA